jgi:hypothetical protein
MSHLRRLALASPALILALALPACGGGSASLAGAALSLPTAAPTALASTTTYTSPDGGIYRNPLRLDVVMVARQDVAPLAAHIGTAAQDWAQLTRFGRFTLVAVRLRNDGKAWSDPELRDLQLASDFAPAGTASGPLRHFYHPTYPLAALSNVPLDGDCQPHLDPGAVAVVVLVYPPVRSASTLVWGRYQDFALRIPGAAGGVGTLFSGGVHAVPCSPPVAPP